jgi:type IV pilus assembly protein PilM
LRLHEFAEQPFPSEGEGSQNVPWLENIRTALPALRTRIKHRGPVTLLLPAQMCLTKFIKLPTVEAAQRQKILQFEAAQNIPYALAEVVWDSVVVNEAPTELEVLLAAAKFEILDPLCAAVQQAGFEPARVVPSSFATLAGFKLLAGNNGAGFLGLNLGSQATTLVLCESTRFALRTFALGLDDSAEAAPNGKLVGPERLESFRIRLLQEVTRSLLHFQWRSGMSKPAHAYLAGSEASVPGLVGALAGKLKVPVQMADVRSIVDFTGSVAGGDEAANAAALIDLIGAASAQFDPAQPMVNLLPPAMHERASYRKRRPWLMAAAMLATTILIPPLLHFRALRDEAIKKSIAVERELAPVRALDRRNSENLRRLAELKVDLQLYRETRERRSSWLRLLAGLQDRLGQVEDVWLDNLQLAPSTIDEPTRLLIAGRMLDRAHPLAKVSPEIFSRVKVLLTRLADLPGVSAVESERFDNQTAGLLKFNFVVVTHSRRPL